MKKLIIMSLTIFAFGLVSCGKSDEDKCKEDSTKEWKDGQCVDKEEEGMAYFIITNKLTVAVTLESGSKSLELAQDACGKVAEADFESLKVSASTTAICDNADATNKCPEADNYEVAAGPNAGDPNKLNKVDKPDDDSACTELAGEEDPEHTVTNLLGEALKVSVGTLSASLEAAVTADSAAAANGSGCVKVKKSQMANLKIEKGSPATVVCDNADANNKCAEGNLLVKAAGDEAVADADANCNAALQ